MKTIDQSITFKFWMRRLKHWEEQLDACSIYSAAAEVDLINRHIDLCKANINRIASAYKEYYSL